MSSENYIQGEQCKWCKVKGLYSKVAKSSGKTHFYWSGDKEYHHFNECKEIQGKIKECSSLDEKMSVWLSYIQKHSLTPPPDYVPSNEPDPERELVAKRKKELAQKREISIIQEPAKSYSSKELAENNISENDILEIETNSYWKAAGKVILQINKSLNNLEEKVDKLQKSFDDNLLGIHEIIKQSITFPTAKQMVEKEEQIPDLVSQIKNKETKTPKGKTTTTTTTKIDVPVINEVNHEKIVDENNEELDIVNEVYDAVDTSVNEVDYDEEIEKIPISK